MGCFGTIWQGSCQYAFRITLYKFIPKARGVLNLALIQDRERSTLEIFIRGVVGSGCCGDDVLGGDDARVVWVANEDLLARAVTAFVGVLIAVVGVGVAILIVAVEAPATCEVEAFRVVLEGVFVNDVAGVGGWDREGVSSLELPDRSNFSNQMRFRATY